ncbi:hypothetical protein C8Q73DRAFT_109377 [Cubamyces lactineus]|nr:hypothetical protein C8Q73DRAFT_109377 [Cubamyces lactineus]
MAPKAGETLTLRRARCQARASRPCGHHDPARRAVCASQDVGELLECICFSQPEAHDTPNSAVAAYTAHLSVGQPLLGKLLESLSMFK